MKNIKLYTILFTVIFGVRCGDFDDINVNPNEPSTVAPEALLTSSLRSINSILGDDSGLLFSQQLAETIYSENSRYQSVQSDFNGWYTGPLANLQKIIDLNTNVDSKDDALSGGSNSNQIAVANILKAYYFAMLTDRYGPMPYSEALRSDILKPKYDSQEDIYNGLFKELKQAVSQISTSEPGVIGDFILGGDMSKWAQFANTLRGNLAIRISKVNPTLGKAEFASARTAGFITETINYPYLGETDNQNPWYANFLTRTDFGISSTLFDYMSANNDPRLYSFGDPTVNSVIAGNPSYAGLAYGLANPTQLPGNVSFPNSTYVKSQTSPLAIFTLAQVRFNEAEAAHLGWISGNAEALYKEAIQASWTQWGVSLSGFDAFYGQAAITWNTARANELLGNQKWVALFTQGYESWAEWRRLDHPNFLVVPTEPLNPSQKIPLRNMYPSTEAQLNKSNYDAALGLLGISADTDGARVWWDK